MTRLVRGLRAVDQSDGSTVAWTRANIGEVLPGVVTPLTWSVFLANLLRRPLSKVEAESSPNGPIRLVKGRAYLRLDALLGSFCYLPGVGPDVVRQALGVDQEVHRSDGWKPRDNLLARLSGGLFLAEILGWSPVLWLQLARLGTPPTGGAFQLGSETVGLSNLSLRAPKGRSNLMADQRLLRRFAPRNDIWPRTEMRPPTDESPTGEGVSTTSSALVRRIEKLIDWNTRCFQLHLKCTRYAIGAYGLLAYMLRHWLPAGGVELGVDLLAGQAELQTAEQGLALWRLAEQARAHPSVAAVLEDEVNWTTAQRALQSTEGGPKFLAALAVFLARHGARTVEEFELASPRWREDPTFVLTVIRNYLHADPALDPAAELRQRRASGDAAIHHIAQQMGLLKGRLFRRVLQAYKADVPLRENMKYRLMEGYEALRHCFLALGDRLCIAGILDGKEDIFFLTAAEALAAGQDGAVNAGEMRAKVNRRRAERACQERFQPPEVIVGNDLSCALANTTTALCHSEERSDEESRFSQPEVAAQQRDSSLPEPALSKAEGVAQNDISINCEAGAESILERGLSDNGMETLQGIGCSPGYAIGQARVIRDIALASHLRPGEILVAPSTDPGWTPLFLTAAAVVTDIGGFLSHGATVAREYGIPAVVNTKRASELVKNGQVIIVDGNQGVVHLSPRNLFETKQET